nr:MAG TPA: hypothetical protein [Caudoviricetes sp.]
MVWRIPVQKLVRGHLYLHNLVYLTREVIITIYTILISRNKQKKNINYTNIQQHNIKW